MIRRTARRLASPLAGVFLFAVGSVFAMSVARAQSAPNAQESANETAVLAIWRLLDYIGVDYVAAVQDGIVIDAGEYAEMTEFVAEAGRRIKALPPSRPPQLDAGIAALATSIATRQPPTAVATQARSLASQLLAAFPVTLAPAAAPDLAEAPALYQEHCAMCHGERGRGDGAAAAGMDPPPVDFHDRARQRERSLFALYGVIGNGVEGTAMPAFAGLSDAQRWALAFHVGQLPYTDAERERGRALWQDAAGRAALPDLKSLAGETPAQLEARVGAEPAAALLAYLRASPQALTASADDALGAARATLAQAVAAHAAGDAVRARDLALSAYLDHFEPIEPALAAKDPALLREVEAAMIALRAGLQAGASAADIAARAATADRLLQRAGAALARHENSEGAAFVSSFIILFREGLEAMLVLVAMVALLRRSARPDAMRYVHAGWIGGLALGLVTWFAATYLIAISGAQRELTEAWTGLVAVTILVLVGLWMHGQSLSGRWQQYVKERIRAELGRNRLWGLTLLAFVAVYREAFETVLFYRALWEQGAHGEILGGFAAAAAALAVAGWALFTAGIKLPIAQFFRASAWLIGALAVILAGKAVAAFQEAGTIGITPLAAPTLEWLGLFPTAESIGAQVGVVAIVLAGVVWNMRRAVLPAPPTPVS